MKHLEQDYEHPSATIGEKIAGIAIILIVAYLFIVG